MGSSLSVGLAYGLDLGGPDGGWNIENGEDFTPRVGDWYDDDMGNLVTQAVTAYLDRKGVSYEKYGEDAALKSLGLEIVYHGVGEWYDYVIATYAKETFSSVAEVDPHVFAQDVSGWNERIQDFLTVLEIKATAKPVWLICADYG